MFRKSIFFLLAVTAATSSFVGCASNEKVEEKVDRQVMQQPQIATPDEIAQQAARAFADAPNLTENQKGDLIGVYLRVYTEAMSIRTQIGQSKALLFQKVAEPNTNRKEIAVLKKKITDLDHQRLAIMFQALDDVEKIIGRGKDTGPVYDHFRDFEYPHSPLDNRGGGRL